MLYLHNRNRIDMKLLIKEIAKEKKIKISALAETVGITQPNMSNIVNGKTKPSLETLEKIADALGVPIGELFGNDSNTITCPNCGAKYKLEK